jgi:hypothetical protein
MYVRYDSKFIGYILFFKVKNAPSDEDDEDIVEEKKTTKKAAA